MILACVLALILAQTARAGPDINVVEQDRTTPGDIVEVERPVVIRGTMFGNLTGPDITIDQSGTVVRNITANRPPDREIGTVRIAGRVTDNITSANVVLLPTARVTGNIH